MAAHFIPTEHYFRDEASSRARVAGFEVRCIFEYLFKTAYSSYGLGAYEYCKYSHMLPSKATLTDIDNVTKFFRDESEPGTLSGAHNGDLAPAA